MTDFTALLEIMGTIALVALPVVVLSRLLAGSDGSGLADVFAFPPGPPLPRGVQEGEPVRYRVERLSRPGADWVAKPRPAGTGRQAVETGPCA